jgi:glutamate--cysteine ligase
VIAARGFDAPASAIGTGRHVGIELEWLTVDADEPTRPAAPAAVAAAATSAAGLLPNASRLTFEPGGQVELSALPLPLGRACDALAEDSEVLGNALADAGIALVSLGLEPGVQRDRVLRTPRYDAMERYFDSCGPAGRTMMRSTAALQVNLDLGSGREIASRWHTAHAIGPVLAAAFANSPIGPDGPTGFRSTRLAVWSTVDDARTAPVDDGAGCRDAWSQYALDAPVMLVRTSADDYEPLVSPLAFGEWIARGHELGWPTIADLDYHLTTLFPPVRPRGWLELRMIDAVPSPWWRVATAVSAVIVEDSAVATSLCEHLEPVRGRWDVAARCGLSDPALAEAARACFTAALAAFPRFGVDQTTRAATEEYLERYVSVGRCPADDRLDDWHAGRPPFPRAENRVRDGAWT